MKFHWPFHSDITFFVDHYSAGVSNKHLLLPHFSLVLFHCATCLCIMQWYFKGCKNDIFS